jgi:hypothetical protein
MKQVSPVFRDKSIPTSRRFRHLGRRHPDMAQHRQEASQRRRFACMDHARISLQKSLNCGFINLIQVGLVDLEPLAEPGDGIHLHRNR